MQRTSVAPEQLLVVGPWNVKGWGLARHRWWPSPSPYFNESSLVFGLWRATWDLWQVMLFLYEDKCAGKRVTCWISVYAGLLLKEQNLEKEATILRTVGWSAEWYCHSFLFWETLTSEAHGRQKCHRCNFPTGHTIQAVGPIWLNGFCFWVDMHRIVLSVLYHGAERSFWISACHAAEALGIIISIANSGKLSGKAFVLHAEGLLSVLSTCSR